MKIRYTTRTNLVFNQHIVLSPELLVNSFGGIPEIIPEEEEDTQNGTTWRAETF
jgi:hypothetical protein